MFFLVYLLVFFALIMVSWTPLATHSIGITNVIPSIWKSVSHTLNIDKGNGLSIIAMAFLLCALLQSKSIQAWFASKREWLQKRKFVAIAIITVTTSLLASTLWWADEFIHFYPLVIPLLLSMGFDVFSSLLCLYGGTIVGVVGSLSDQGRTGLFDEVINPNAGTHFTGEKGFFFSAMVWVVLTTLLVFFNIWYCNKIQKKPVALPSTNDQTKAEKIPTFNWRRKLVLILSFFFILVSILGTFGFFADLMGNSTKKIPEWICKTEEKKKYTDLGTVDVSPNSPLQEKGKNNEKNENVIDIARKETKKTSDWKIFGKWGSAQQVYLFTIGGIIICLIAKLNIINTLITAIVKTIPILLVYIFTYTVSILLKSMELKIGAGFLPSSRLLVLPAIFVVILLLNFFSINADKPLFGLIAKSLKSFSANTLAYSVTIAYMARFLSYGFSPFSGNLQMSLTATKISYKQYIKKTWLLWTIIFAICLVLIFFLPWFIDRGNV